MKTGQNSQNFLKIYCSRHHLISTQEIARGWSADKKYLAVSWTGKKFLLRTTHAKEKFPHKQQEFAALKTLEKLGLPIPKAIDLTCGSNGETICMLLSWIPGQDLADVIQNLPPEEQYRLGIAAGKILRQLHTIPAPDEIPRWEEWFSQKMDRRTKAYTASGIRLPHDEKILAYITANRHLIHNRPQCFQHGDYHIGNMVLNEDGTFGIIDFDRTDYGDPWEEFNRITWCRAASAYFAAGRIDGYFDGEIPEKFWKLCLLYICSDMIGAAAAAVSLGENEVTGVMQTARDVFSWFNEETDADNPVPDWYRSARINIKNFWNRAKN